MSTTKGDLKKVAELLQKENKDASHPFKVERYLIMAMEEGHFEAALKDIG